MKKTSAETVDCVIKTNIPLFVTYFGVQKTGVLYMRAIYNLMDLASKAGGLISGINKFFVVLVSIFCSIKVKS
jgi:hypothetical protein